MIAGAREQIRAAGRRIAVLDDDPTGSQAVHDVAIVTALDDDELTVTGNTTFFLTNTRSLDEADAVALTERVARTLLERDPELELVSRSDSTLRGHVVAEIRAVDQARRAVLGSGYDGVLLVPAYFEAGRSTHDDIHWAGDVPVGETEFAQDATFGYRASNLREFVAEKRGDTDAVSLSWRTSGSAGPSASRRCCAASATAAGWSSTRSTTQTSRSSCSGCARVGARSSTAPGRRSCGHWPGWSRARR